MKRGRTQNVHLHIESKSFGRRVFGGTQSLGSFSRLLPVFATESSRYRGVAWILLQGRLGLFDVQRKIAERGKKTDMKLAALLLTGTFLWVTSPYAHADHSTKSLGVSLTVVASCCLSVPDRVRGNSADDRSKLEMEVSGLTRSCCAIATPVMINVDAVTRKAKTGNDRDEAPYGHPHGVDSSTYSNFKITWDHNSGGKGDAENSAMRPDVPAVGSNQVIRVTIDF